MLSLNSTYLYIRLIDTKRFRNSIVQKLIIVTIIDLLYHNQLINSSDLKYLLSVNNILFVKNTQTSFVVY